MPMADIWTGQRNRPLRLLEGKLAGWGKGEKKNTGDAEESLPTVLLPNGEMPTADELAGADILYLTAETGDSGAVAALTRWARQREILVLWNPGRLKNARMLPAQGCVILQSELSAEEERMALRELFCTPGLTTTLDRKKLLLRLKEASGAVLAMAQADGREKKRFIDRSLALQGWRMPRKGALVVSIGISADCRLEEVVELWHGTVEQTEGLEVLWGTSFSMEQPDTLRLVLLSVAL